MLTENAVCGVFFAANVTFWKFSEVRHCLFFDLKFASALDRPKWSKEKYYI